MAFGRLVAAAKRRQARERKRELWERYRAPVEEIRALERMSDMRNPAPMLSVRSVHMPARGLLAMSLLGRLVGR